jgi:GABA permease
VVVGDERSGGGGIGAGLFVGLGAFIGEVGPAAFLTYAITGVLIVMVMRMLGEMAVANPSTGSFADYARQSLGGWAGFSVGWLYWYFWVIVVGFEAVAGAGILHRRLPGVPLWVIALVLMLLMTATNLFSVTSYGEFGPGALFSGIVIVIISMVGAEIATIAAAASAEPERGIVKATNSVVLRISVFFVGSIFLLATILPWNSTELGDSPYVSAMEEMGIPAAADIMNFVVLTAVLSCLNSGLYTASRMLFMLAARREAPARMLSINARGVPMWSNITSTLVGFACVVAAYVSPDRVFLFLLNSSGAVILFVYLLICLSQLRMRGKIPPERLG